MPPQLYCEAFTRAYSLHWNCYEYINNHLTGKAGWLDKSGPPVWRGTIRTHTTRSFKKTKPFWPRSYQLWFHRTELVGNLLDASINHKPDWFSWTHAEVTYSRNTDERCHYLWNLAKLTCELLTDDDVSELEELWALCVVSSVCVC